MSRKKELEIFEYIKSRLSEGISPSVREIMDAAGFKSTSTAHYYINALIDQGLLEQPFLFCSGSGCCNGWSADQRCTGYYGIYML